MSLIRYIPKKEVIERYCRQHNIPYNASDYNEDFLADDEEVCMSCEGTGLSDERSSCEECNSLGVVELLKI